jgi:DNA-binding PadR family transcriptional regulator
MSSDLNATAASLLGFLHQGAMTGWDLVQTVEDSIGDFWNVTRSQVYRELRSLQEQGLVEAGETGARDRRPYAITEAGRAAFRAWIAREPGEDVIRSPLLLTVFFGEHVDPELLARHLTLHRIRHQQRLGSYEELAAELEGQPGVEWPLQALRFGIAYERALLSWMDQLPVLSGAATAPAAPGRGGS